MGGGEEAEVGVGVAAFVGGGVVRGAELERVFFVQGAGVNLVGAEEVFEGAAVLQVLGSAAEL